MKATGIVRRIDDLGRIVVPKEIRRTLRVREGEPMEIFTGREGEIVLKKYSPMGELTRFAKEYTQVLSQITGFLVCVSDQGSNPCCQWSQDRRNTRGKESAGSWKKQLPKEGQSALEKKRQERLKLPQKIPVRK